MPRPSLIRSIASCLLLSAALCSCGGGGSGSGSGDPGGGTQYPQPPAGFAFLTQSDVMTIVQTAAATADPSTMAIAVTDRVGNIVAVWEGASMPATSTGNFGQAVPTGELAVSSCADGFIFQQRSGAAFLAHGALHQRNSFSAGHCEHPERRPLRHREPQIEAARYRAIICRARRFPRPRRSADRRIASAIITGKADVNDSDPTAVNPGGVPIFKSGHVVGGVGIAGVPLDVAEFVAYTAAGLIGVPSADADGIGFQPLPAPGEVVIDGIALPFVEQHDAAELTSRRPPRLLIPRDTSRGRLRIRLPGPARGLSGGARGRAAGRAERERKWTASS